jgi:tetratricopeptide (TPR) repeat protein
MAEHWLYLPGLGLALGLAAFIPRSKAMAGFALGIALALSGVTLVQNTVWRDAESFYNNIFDNGEQSGRAHSSLAQYYYVAGDYAKAEEQYLLTVAHPAPMSRMEMSAVYMHLGTLFLGARPNEDGMITEREIAVVMPLTPRLDAAIEAFEEAANASPNLYWAHQFLAVLYDYKGDQARARQHADYAAALLNGGHDPDRLY